MADQGPYRTPAKAPPPRVPLLCHLWHRWRPRITADVSAAYGPRFYLLDACERCGKRRERVVEPQDILGLHSVIRRYDYGHPSHWVGDGLPPGHSIGVELLRQG